MIIDIILVVLLAIAVFKGYQRGLIVAVFSFVSLFIGLAAALKLSAWVAGYIGDAVKVSQQWLPVISFLVVFIGIILLVRWAANLLQKGVQLAMLGWVNRAGGILLYAALYILVYSIVLFYADQLDLVKAQTKENSVSYQYIQPLGPWLIDGFGRIIPIFKDMFIELQDFFGTVSRQLPASN